MDTPPFSVLLEQISDRSAALREAAARVDLAAPVPGCPGWSVRDLVAHLGEVQRFWAVVAAAGPRQQPPGDDEVPGRLPSGDLLAWSEESTGALLAALRQAGPGQGCWTWWAASPAPQDTTAVARHQVQEAAVHARDAQAAAGSTAPLPAAIALDGVDEFLTVSLGAMAGWQPWPHDPAQVAFRAAEGASWLVSLERGGGGVTRPPDGALPGADAVITGSASDLVLFLYGREGAEPVRVEGDHGLAGRLTAWAPTD